MQAQIVLLRAILSGHEPPSPENLKKALNRDVLAERAIHNQNASIEATLNALDSEVEKLRTQLERREKQTNRLKATLGEKLEATKEQEVTDFKPLQQMDSVRDVIIRIANGYLADLGVGTSNEAISVLWSLCQVSSRSEQLLVPADLQIVQYLVDEGLIRSEPVGRNRLRIRMF